MDLSENEKLISANGNRHDDANNSAKINGAKRNRVSRCSQKRKKITKTGRIVLKSGQFNIEKRRQWNFRAFPDIVKIFIESQWKWTILCCVITYITIWLTFTGIWWLILELHGDLEPERLPDVVNATEWTPCVKQIYGFTSIFLFSIEVHTTIGYGNRVITLECPSAIFTMCMESIVGSMTQCFIVGIVFAKLTRPKNRAQTLLFSKNAIINQRDRNLSLIFRVGNTRKSRIIAVSVQAFLIKNNSVLDEHIKLNLTMDSSENTSFIFPIFAVHTIDKDSPLYRISAFEILKRDLEILVVLEGTIESTGQPLQVKTSYTTQEILWGHRFVNMVTYSKDKHGFIVDYSQFDQTNPVNTPLCSAEQLNQLYSNKLKVPKLRYRHSSDYTNLF